MENLKTGTRLGLAFTAVLVLAAMTVAGIMRLQIQTNPASRSASEKVLASRKAYIDQRKAVYKAKADGDMEQAAAAASAMQDQAGRLTGQVGRFKLA